MARQKKIKATESEVIEYQPDAVEIEEKPVSGKIRWVLYIILTAIIGVFVGALVFHVDRIVVAEGKLITTSPTLVVQSLNTAIVRSIKVEVGDIVNKDQLLATLDSTFASADLSQLKRQYITLNVQIRRIQAELEEISFSPLAEEGEDGKLQLQVFQQRRLILERTRQMSEDKKAALQAKLALNDIKRVGLRKQLKLLRDIEGTTAKLPQVGEEYRLRLLDAQKARFRTADEIENLLAEDDVLLKELSQVESQWQQFIEERTGKLLEEEVRLRNELEKVTEERNKARRLHELVSLRAPQKGIVLSLAERSVGSILKEAEPFITLVPIDSTLQAEVDVPSKDIGRIRVGDSARVKLDSFPFQRHGTLDGKVRVISENAFQQRGLQFKEEEVTGQPVDQGVYRTRLTLLSHKLKNVPVSFRLMPGMKVRAEIKVGKRRVISYFLYPIIRALDESLREP